MAIIVFTKVTTCERAKSPACIAVRNLARLDEFRGRNIEAWAESGGV